MGTKLAITLLLLSLLSLSSALSTTTLSHAGQILLNSNYLSMSLTLQLVSNSNIIPNSQFLTIFAPSDLAFTLTGQPSLSLLQFHFSPLAFPLHSLRSLHLVSKIPTFLANHSITVTSSLYDDDEVSLNGVKISMPSPVYDDGSLIIYGIESFFDPGFEFPGLIHRPSRNILGCSVKATRGGDGYYSFSEANGVLRSKGYSVMASFLDLQLLGYKESTVLTVFAPVDEAMDGYVGNVSEYGSIFLRHVVPCRILWRDLVDFEDGVVLETYLYGFGIEVRKSGDILMLSDVPISFPNMYSNGWLVVHGLGGMLEGPERPQGMAESSSETKSSSEEIILDDGEF